MDAQSYTCLLYTSGSTGKAHLVGQLVQRIALEQCTGLNSLVHLTLNVLLAAVAGLGRAADGVETFCVLQNVGIADLCVDAARLVGGSVDDIVAVSYTHLDVYKRQALGNDVGCPYITQYDFWRELCYFHKYCGVSNQFALYTATLRNAQLAGVGDVTGSIEPGKSADFIVTKHNPLDDLRALQHLELVVCRGHVIKKPNPKRNKTVDALLDPYLE